MDATELKKLQAPLKEKYRSDPGSAMITLKASGTVGENVTCKVHTGRALVTAGLHPATGGTGLQACSGDMLLEALVACAGVTIQAVSTAIGVKLESANIETEGDLDFRGTLAVSKEAPVGFSRIRLKFNLVTNAAEEEIKSLISLTERYCVVYQTLVSGVLLSTEVNTSSR